MKRRRLLAASGLGFCGSLAGCLSRFNLHCPRPWLTEELPFEAYTPDHPWWATSFQTEEAVRLFTAAGDVDEQHDTIETFVAEHDTEVEGFEADRSWLLETDFDEESVIAFQLVDRAPASGDSFSIRWIEQTDTTITVVTCLPSTAGHFGLASFHKLLRIEHRAAPRMGKVTLAHPSGGERTIRTDGTVTDDPPSITPF